VVSIVAVVFLFYQMAPTFSGSYYDEYEFFSSFMVMTGLSIATSLIGFGIWLWSVIDTAVKKDEWYSNYPNVK
jgi:hypothetical protein